MLTLIVSILTLCFGVSVQETVKVSILYETYCPDCHEFILEQLPPTYEKIGSSLIIDFVPYGNARTTKKDGKYSFECQHGPKECIGNMGHACELHLNKGPVMDMKYISCTLKTGHPSSLDVMAKCARGASVDFSAIKQCLDSDLSSELLAQYGEQTPNKIDGVPFIIYNDHFNQTLCNLARNDFFQTTCGLFKTKPAACLGEDFKTNLGRNAQICAKDDIKVIHVV